MTSRENQSQLTHITQPGPSPLVSLGAWAALTTGGLLIALSFTSGLQILLRLINPDFKFSENPRFSVVAAVTTIVLVGWALFAGIRRVLGEEPPLSSNDLGEHFPQKSPVSSPTPLLNVVTEELNRRQVSDDTRGSA